MVSRGTRLVRVPILVTTTRVPSVSSALREGRTMSLRSTPASTSLSRSPTVVAGTLCFSTFSLATLSATFLGVVSERDMPERSMSALRLTESAAPPKRTPTCWRALETLVAVVHTVRFSPSMLRASGRPMRTAMREPSLDRGVDARDDGVVGGGLDALACQHLTDVVAEGADLGCLAVDRHGHGPAHGRVGRCGADQCKHDRCDQAAEQGLVSG